MDNDYHDLWEWEGEEPPVHPPVPSPGSPAIREGKGVGNKDLERYQAHFRENVSLVVKLLVIWALVSYGASAAVTWLNQVKILTGFPLGYYMGAQGSLVVFVILIFVYAYKMAQIDKKYGVDE
jgi:putative solute:sodium symporter small subunit